MTIIIAGKQLSLNEVDRETGERVRVRQMTKTHERVEGFLMRVMQKKCPKCGAKSNERCVQNGKRWDQGVHKARTY